MIIKQVLEGLIVIHSNDITHLDLKLSNILVDKEFVPKICDFGVIFLHFQNYFNFIKCIILLIIKHRLLFNKLRQ